MKFLSNKPMPRFCFLTVFVLLASASHAQQIADTSFSPLLSTPAYPSTRGPVVLLDEAHGNFHTVNGRYLPFARLLRRDGYTVQALSSSFSNESLRAGKVLVIANALAQRNQGNWSLPTPSPFTEEEIAAVRGWVHEGGALLLIADHMPFAGAAEKLAAAFGIRFSNCFALSADSTYNSTFVFRSADGTLATHAISKGRTNAERIDSLVAFTGSAFQAEGNVQPLLLLNASQRLLMPTEAWQFNAETPKLSAEGWLQGATLQLGKGRIAIFGEAAMFTAQLAGPEREPMGMNSSHAPQNFQFLLNVMHWLSGMLH